jgi:hypothetical protein
MKKKSTTKSQHPGCTLGSAPEGVPEGVEEKDTKVFE